MLQLLPSELGKKGSNRNLSKECLDEIKTRNKLKKKAKLTNLQMDWENWKVAKNKVNDILRREATSKDKVEQLAAQSDMTGKMLWNRVKRMAGWATSLSPTKFSTENGIISEPKQMANNLNDHFCNKISNICSELERRNKSDPLTLERKPREMERKG